MTDNLRKSTDLSTRHGLRTGLKVEDIKQSFLDNLLYAKGRAPAVATNNDLYTALAITVRDRVFHRFASTASGSGT
jgi:glycogen phosphorylase